MATLTTGEFYGSMGELERRQRKARAQVSWLRGFVGDKTLRLYVDEAGTIFAPSRETGRLTRIVGQCIPKE